MRPGHHQRGRNALVRDVPDGDPDPALGHLDEVVEITADGTRRAVIRGDLPMGQIGQLTWKELLLDERGDPHFLLESLVCRDLRGLFPHELGDPDRRCRVTSERGQEAPVVGRVLLL